MIDFASTAISVVEGAGTVYADTDRGHTPPEVNGRVPDLLYRNGDDVRVYEVETCDSIDHEHTEGQWTDFSEYAEDRGANFTVIVPTDCEEQAERRIDELGLPNADVWAVSP
jgi:hypothetical protein